SLVELPARRDEHLPDEVRKVEEVEVLEAELDPHAVAVIACEVGEHPEGVTAEAGQPGPERLRSGDAVRLRAAHRRNRPTPRMRGVHSASATSATTTPMRTTRRIVMPPLPLPTGEGLPDASEDRVGGLVGVDEGCWHRVEMGASRSQCWRNSSVGT